MASRRGAFRAVMAVVALCCLVGAGVLLWIGLNPAVTAGGAALLDLDGRPVVLDDVPDAAAADPVPTGGTFAAPRQGLEVPLVEMNVVRDVINPPTLTDAFLVRGFGSPREPGSGLVVVAMHAVRGGNAPGNAFFTMGATESPLTVEVGDPLVVDGVEFAVTGSQVLGKDAAASSDAVWGRPAERDGELVVITCLQRTWEWGSAADNLVIFAQRAG